VQAETLHRTIPIMESQIRAEPAACAGCGNPIPVNTAYRIAGLPESYCSRTCVDTAFQTFIQGRRKVLRDTAKPTTKTANPADAELAEDIIPEPDHDLEPEESSMMESAISKEFGDATIVRHICDRKGCGKPVTLGWKGRDGEYCSNACLKQAERVTKENIKMTTELNEEVDTTTHDDDSPVTAGKSSDKKKKKKAKGTKITKAPGKTAKAPDKSEAKAKSKANGAAKANGSGRNTSIGSQTIHLTKKESELKGKRAQIFKLIKSGMTVSQLQEAAAKKLGDDSYKARALAVLRTCVDNDLCTVK